MSEAFILGAGFSKAVRDAMPTLRELSERILPELWNRDSELADRLTRMGSNVELWMSYLSQSQPWLSVEQNQYNLSFTGVIRKLIHSHIVDLVSKTNTVPGWMTRLVYKWYEERVTVISLNYDTLVEYVTADLKVPEYDEVSRSLTAWDVYPRYLVNASTRGASIWGGQTKDTFKLLKLHGSTNWYYSGQPDFHGENIFYTFPWGFAPTDDESKREVETHAMVSDKEALIIPPVTEKSIYFKNETIGRIWWEAAQTLRNASCVVVIGYSLPQSDLGMRSFLATVAGKGKKEVFVVDTDAGIPSHYRDLLGSSEIVDTFAGKEDSVPRFASDYCEGDI